MIRALFSFQINKILLISWQFWLDRQEIEGWAQMGSAGPKVSMKVSMGFHQGAGVMGLPGAQMSSEVSMDFTAIRFSGVRKVAKADGNSARKSVVCGLRFGIASDSGFCSLSSPLCVKATLRGAPSRRGESRLARDFVRERGTILEASDALSSPPSARSSARSS